MISIKLFFILFSLGGAIYYYFICKAYRYSKKRGYNPHFGISWREFSKFLKLLSDSSKKYNDKKLKAYLLMIYLSFGFCMTIMLTFAFN